MQSVTSRFYKMREGISEKCGSFCIDPGTHQIHLPDHNLTSSALIQCRAFTITDGCGFSSNDQGSKTANKEFWGTSENAVPFSYLLCQLLIAFCGSAVTDMKLDAQHQRIPSDTWDIADRQEPICADLFRQIEFQKCQYAL